MAINFTKNIEQYTTTQKTTRAKNFTEYTSKKQLENAEILDAQKLEFLKNIKGTFSFSVHKDLRYTAVTLYKANAEKKYSFLVVDLQELAIAEVDSIKQAKAEIMELIAQTQEVTPAVEEDAEPAAEEVSEEDAEQEDAKPARRRRNKKNSAEEEVLEA